MATQTVARTAPEAAPVPETTLDLAVPSSLAAAPPTLTHPASDLANEHEGLETTLPGRDRVGRLARRAARGGPSCAPRARRPRVHDARHDPARGKPDHPVSPSPGAYGHDPSLARRLAPAGLKTKGIALSSVLRLGRRMRDGEGRGPVRLSTAALLPGLAFFAIGRPISGVACLALQASLVGWIPAALWAAFATRQVHVRREKQRALVARLRPS